MKVWWVVSVIPSSLSLCQSSIFGELLCQVDLSEEGGFIGETLCRRRPTEGELVCQRDYLASADHFVLFVWETVCHWEILSSPVSLRRVSENWVLLAFSPSTPKSSMLCCKLFLQLKIQLIDVNFKCVLGVWDRRFLRVCLFRLRRKQWRRPIEGLGYGPRRLLKGLVA